MRDFLSEYITSLTKKRRERVQDILRTAQVGKSQLDVIVEQLNDLRLSSPITIGLENFGSLITANKFDSTYRDALLRLEELYRMSNLVSLILDSHSSLLVSEIKALEDEIVSIEKAIDNYAFTLEENGAYDYAFIETFADQIMADTEAFSQIPDRDGTLFTPEQHAYINTRSGILTLDPDLTKNYKITGEVLQHNCMNFVTSETPLSEAFNDNSGTGWKLNVSSPRPISTSLDASGTNIGAQVKIRGTLPSPSPCDCLIITPLADSPIELLSVWIYKDDFNTNPVNVLEKIVLLEQPHVVSFPLQSVVGFELVINQPIYMRGAVPPDTNEELHKKVFNDVKEMKKTTDRASEIQYQYNREVLQRVLINNLKKYRLKNLNLFSSQVPTTNFVFSPGMMSFVNNKIRTLGGEGYKYNFTSDIVRRMIHEKVFASNKDVINDTNVLNVATAFLANASTLNSNMFTTSQEYPRINVDSPIKSESLSTAITTNKDFLNYRYSLGLKNVEIGTGVRNFKGVFISKQLPSNSNADEVKLKADYTNYNLVGTSRDNGRITSIEFSVTNKSNPYSESDWIPILPLDESEIEGERVFFDEAGIAYPRFRISAVNEIALFKNGYRVSSDLITYNYTEDNLAIKSIRLPISEIFVTDIFTLNYTPFGESGIVRFADKGFDQNILASAFDDLGGGETYFATGNGNVVTLRHSPYINYDLVQSQGSYSTSLGFTGLYQPITIIMSDGTLANNFTNYKGITQVNLADVPSSTIGYIHSGNNIVFNQPITQQFTVYYQYLPNNLRYRVILRCNNIDYVSPILNTLQVKAKTRKSDARKAF